MVDIIQQRHTLEELKTKTAEEKEVVQNLRNKLNP